MTHLPTDSDARGALSAKTRMLLQWVGSKALRYEARQEARSQLDKSRAPASPDVMVSSAESSEHVTT